jgi:hypothetical protein
MYVVILRPVQLVRNPTYIFFRSESIAGILHIKRVG